MNCASNWTGNMNSSELIGWDHSDRSFAPCTARGKLRARSGFRMSSFAVIIITRKLGMRCPIKETYFDQQSFNTWI